EQLSAISEKVNSIVTKLRGIGISVKYDNNDNKKPGWKFAEYELKGVPVRIAIGPRDLENGTVEVARRDTLEKQVVSMENIELYVQQLLNDIQENIFNKAIIFRKEMTTPVETYEEFKEVLQNKGGFILAHWDGTSETEQMIKDETKATIRCIPFDQVPEEGICMYSGKPSKSRVIFALSY
ncbi:MAG: His/Gly/Thr/Pro-type tRNA ligase C-terminal domain-containing protein, partial [Bacteroidota bacterium]|nr:His/Gly/Thr/Pro-type tRNA ligase C-terminal domain-containing protein [Bacteroidota bacterium]